MSLTVAEGSGGFKSVEPGAYVARCIRIVDIGTQKGEYLGKPITRKQIIVTWELPTELIPEGEYAGQPYVVSRFYTASLNEKATLRKDLEAWRGREFTTKELEGFDLKKIVGVPCMLSIIHNDKGKAKINGIMAVSKGIPIPPLVNETYFFEIDHWNDDVFQKLSEKMQALIKQSSECNPTNEAVVTHEEPLTDGDIPF